VSAPLELRKAAMADLPVLLRLINSNADQGLMLPRTEFELAEHLRDFTVACAEGEVVGCCALHFYTPTMGEIRSLAVDPARRRKGAGRMLVETLVEEARSAGLRAVFAFTYIPGFFGRLGFQEIAREALPLKVWRDCLGCRKYDCCDEIAVVKPLNGPEVGPGAGEEAARAGLVLPTARPG